MQKIMRFLGFVALYFDVLTRCNLKPLCNLSQLMESWEFEEPQPPTTTANGCQTIHIEIKNGIVTRLS